MRKESMTSRERWEAILKREKPDRLPMDYWGTDETNEKILKYFRLESMEQFYTKFHLDVPLTIDIGLASDSKPDISLKYIGTKLEKGKDIYGLRYKKVEYKGGSYSECINHPLAEYETIEEIEKNYVWPSPDWFDYSVIKSQIKGKEDRPIIAGGSEPFLTYKDLRGDEQAFMDLILNPEIVEYCLDKLFDFRYEYTSRIYEQIPGQITCSYIAEDLGAQNDLMYSPDQIRKFLLPRMKRMIDLAHSAGIYVFHHDDGSIRKIIPDLIKIGIDILNPIQWKLPGMDRESLKKDFGDKVIFHGGVDNQYTLPFGSLKEVEEEVIKNIEILGEGGGYILAPSHKIQSITPPENIEKMFEIGYEYVWR
jgi:uroporphyrinogen decarboxylase